MPMLFLELDPDAVFVIGHDHLRKFGMKDRMDISWS